MIFVFGIDVNKLRLSEAARQDLESSSNAQLMMFENCMSAILRGLGGVEGSKLRAYNRILNKLDSAAITQSLSIDLDPSEVDILKLIFLNDTVKIDPSFVRAFSLYQSELENKLLSKNE